MTSLNNNNTTSKSKKKTSLSKERTKTPYSTNENEDGKENDFVNNEILDIHRELTFKPKKVRKHQGINQIGGNKGRLKKGYKYSGKKLKSGLPKIIKVQKKKLNQ